MKAGTGQTGVGCSIWYCIGRGKETQSVAEDLLVSPSTLPFPRRAASSIHVRHHMVQHVGQCVFYHGSPAHVTHLGWDEETSKDNILMPTEKPAVRWRHLVAEVETKVFILTGWYLRSFGGCLKCGPKLTETVQLL